MNRQHQGRPVEYVGGPLDGDTIPAAKANGQMWSETVAKRSWAGVYTLVRDRDGHPEYRWRPLEC